MDINFPVTTSICTIHVEGFTSELPSSVQTVLVFLVLSVFFLDIINVHQISGHTEVYKLQCC